MGPGQEVLEKSHGSSRVKRFSKYDGSSRVTLMRPNPARPYLRSLTRSVNSPGYLQLGIVVESSFVIYHLFAACLQNFVLFFENWSGDEGGVVGLSSKVWRGEPLIQFVSSDLPRGGLFTSRIASRARKHFLVGSRYGRRPNPTPNPNPYPNRTQNGPETGEKRGCAAFDDFFVVPNLRTTIYLHTSLVTVKFPEISCRMKSKYYCTSEVTKLEPSAWNNVIINFFAFFRRRKQKNALLPKVHKTLYACHICLM